MRVRSYSRLSLFAAALFVALLSVAPAQAGRRTGDKSTLRVPAARTQLVQDLLQHTAEADAAAEAEAERLQRARELVAAADREAALRAALRPAPAPAPVAAPPVVEPVAPSPIEARITPPETASAPVVVAQAPSPDPAPAAPKAPAPLAPAFKEKELQPSASAMPNLGDSTKIALGALALLLGAWLLRRKKGGAKNEAQIPSHLRCLGKVPLGKNWQISLLELPGEVLVLGTGEGGVQVLARIDDEDRIEELRRAQLEGSKGLGHHLKGLMGMLRPTNTRESAALERAQPRLADPAGDMPSPAELVEMQRALDMHRAFAGRSFAPPSALAPSNSEPHLPPAPPVEESELETMRQRLADLRAGRFAQ